MATNRRLGDRGLVPPAETIIQYTWDTWVDLRDVGAPGDGRLVLHPCGTLVVDDQVNVLYWIAQTYDERRLERVRAHVRTLFRDGRVGLNLGSNVRSARPVVLRRDESRNVTLGLNTARMHEGRPK